MLANSWYSSLGVVGKFSSKQESVMGKSSITMVAFLVNSSHRGGESWQWLGVGFQYSGDDTTSTLGLSEL